MQTGCYVDAARGRYVFDGIVQIVLPLAQADGKLKELRDEVDRVFGANEVQRLKAVFGDDVDELRDLVEDVLTEYMESEHHREGYWWGRSEEGDWGLWEVQDD